MRHRWVVWFVIVQHFAWAAFLLASAAPMGITAIGALARFERSRWAVLLTYATAAMLAALGMRRRTPSRLAVLFFLPQFMLLALSAVTATGWALLGHYADGVPRPTLFIGADQLHTVLLAAFYGSALWGSWKGERKRER